MSITNFYTDTLGANLVHARWSWGATNANTNQIFLRVWQDQLEVVDGVERVLIFKHGRKSKSNGYPERKRHVEALRAGANGYGVVCTAKNVTESSRNIASFDQDTLLQFGDIVDDGDAVYGVVVSRVPVTDLARPRSGTSSVIPDLKAIFSRRVEATEKVALANARVGQGQFRARVLAMWNSRCCVTGSTTLDAIRASHIKPWRDSSDAERLDENNGLPLLATLDSLFDVGLISFSDDGKMLVSSRVSNSESTLLGLDGCRMTKQLNEFTMAYLEHHRKDVFR